MAKALIVSVLGWQVRRMQKQNKFKTVAVAGSIGKTSTKFAIARVLATSLRVRFQEGNYNDLVSVPLVYFNQSIPSLFNPIAWLRVFILNEKQIKSDYPYDVVVLELGTNGPGQMAAFKRFVKADITVVTSIVAEHMEFFKDLTQVAAEELTVKDYSKQLIINTDLCAPEYLKDLSGYMTYSKHSVTDYQLMDVTLSRDGSSFAIRRKGQPWIQTAHTSFADTQLYSLTAAAAIADLMGIKPEAIIKGFSAVSPVAGRMQRLNGIKNSVILDDSYNASPAAMKAALDTLYNLEAPQKIALLGNMNELGAITKEEHTKIGEYCDPKKLSEVLTLGPEANTYLADAARKQGCPVETFDAPYDAGQWLAQHVQNGALILVKGSQNRVFAEEAIKPILANPEDRSKLVRQSPKWLKVKETQFGKEPV